MSNSKKLNSWTNEDIKFVKKNYPKKGAKFCAEKLNKTEYAIKAKIKVLKLKKKPLLVVSRAKATKKSKVTASKKRSNTYSNACGVKKQHARDIILEAIKVHGIIPSLPFSTCELERQILSKNPNAFKFIGCEKDADTYIEMFKTIKNDEILKNAITPHYGLIGDFLMNAKENAFSNLILDYCGTLETFKKEITHSVVANIVGVGGAICVTLTKRGSAIENNIFNEINKNIPSNLFEDGVGEIERAIRAFFINLVTSNPNYSIETFFPYQDDKKEDGRPALNKCGKIIKNAAMVLFVIRRNK